MYCKRCKGRRWIKDLSKINPYDAGMTDEKLRKLARKARTIPCPLCNSTRKEKK